MNYICHSGGAKGSDIFWENEGKRYGIKTISYSFTEHYSESKHPTILSEDELIEGYRNVKIANRTLKRNISSIKPYIRNLISRDWYQVKNSDSIYAVGMLNGKSQVFGGTGWAVQMAIDNNKPIFLFEQSLGIWMKYDRSINCFDQIKNTRVILTENFAGIGTRSLNSKGYNAIKNVYIFNFETRSVIRGWGMKSK